jgi:hypothetical protein
MVIPMRASVNALLLLLALATDKALARYVQFLKVENHILRSKLPRVVKVTPQERRRLVKFGRPLGSALKELTQLPQFDAFFDDFSHILRRKSLSFLARSGREPM